MASGGRYYVIEGKRYTEKEYLRLSNKPKAPKSTPKSGSPKPGAKTSKPSNSEE